ncbi:hypothetical protein [Clostridium sp. E02]|uniref:hypothetical protein n=1 Tax=Clostridium sp. E02 TaxID=2487134 RepID=UPI000F52812B|nr:hypothetical protein [Clostridium sp. E02]
MSGYQEIVLSPENFKNKNTIQAAILLESPCDVLLTGTVYNINCECVEGAVVQITEISRGNQRKNLGFVITNLLGEFAVSVKNNKTVSYQLDIYEPLFPIDKGGEEWNTQ